MEEAPYAFTARLQTLAPQDQTHTHGQCGHRLALPGAPRQIAVKSVTYGLMHFVVVLAVAYAPTCARPR